MSKSSLSAFPLISVIIPVYNGEKYLAAAIESVFAQTYSQIELLLVDDGSQDATEQIAREYGAKIRYFPEANRGQPAAMNYALAMAKGAYIAFLDADDLYLPDKTALQVAFLEREAQVDFVFGYVEQFVSPELPQAEKEKWACPAESSPGYLAVAGLFRKECFERVGLFNEEQPIGVFIEWYMRAADRGLKNEVISNRVARRRIHDSNMGIYSQHRRLEYVQIVKAALTRREKR